MNTFHKLLIMLVILLPQSMTREVSASNPFVTKDTTHYVGELFGGGVIFYVDTSKKHGLICSMSDIRDPLRSPRNRPSPNAQKDRSDIITKGQNAERAHEVCETYTNSNYGTGQFSDWYLPAIEELRILYRVKNTINESLEKYDPKIVDYLDKIYWSSSVVKADLIPSNQLMDFENGTLIITMNRPMTFVRAIRKF
jgi:hypothetical protein